MFIFARILCKSEILINHADITLIPLLLGGQGNLDPDSYGNMTTSWPDPGRMALYGVAGSVAIYIYTRYRAAHSIPKELRLPPGPGLLGFPSERWYENFSEWQKKYGMRSFSNVMRIEEPLAMQGISLMLT
jgi:hypothetical protein